MTEQVSVTTERVDDIPLLLSHSDKMGVPELLDDYFKPHGNWEGMSLGWTTAIWLTHIVSEGDHRMNQMQGWAAHRVQTLSISTGQEVSERSFRDDRLALVLDALSDEQKWQQFETALNRQLIRVYDLKPKRVRVDSTTVSGYWTVTEEGLFQLGYSKDHRPDLPQLKVMLSALDPLGLPVATQVVSGERADDRLYLPAIAQVSQSLNAHGLLYVGDCTMAALAILKQHQVDGLVQVSIEEQVQERPVRAYGDRPAAVRVQRTLSLHATVDEPEVARAARRLGWRVYVTNHPTTGLSLEQAVLAYREEYLVEHGFGRLKGKPLSLSPMYVQSDQRATGLVRLLSIGLRV